MKKLDLFNTHYRAYLPQLPLPHLPRLYAVLFISINVVYAANFLSYKKKCSKTECVKKLRV